MTFEKRLKVGREVSHVEMENTRISDRGNSRCKCPETERGLGCFQVTAWTTVSSGDMSQRDEESRVDSMSLFGF